MSRSHLPALSQLSAGFVLVPVILILAGCGEDPPVGLTGNPDNEDEVVQPGGTQPEGTGQAQPAVGANGTSTPPPLPMDPSQGTPPPLPTTPGTTAASTPPPLPPPATESSADRKAAQWVLNVGGRFGTGRGENWIGATAQIPAGPFRIVRVNLRDCNLDQGEGLTALSGLEQLEDLNLTESTVDDGQFDRLKQAPALLQLSLRNTNLTDISVPALQKFTSLKRLEVSPGISDAAIAELKAALPGCQVDK